MQAGRIFWSLLFVVLGFVTSAQQTIPVCQGFSKTLVAHSPDAVTYQWFKDGELIPGATAATLVAINPGSYQAVCITEKGCVSTVSNNMTLIAGRSAAINDTFQFKSSKSLNVLANDQSLCFAIDTNKLILHSTPVHGNVSFTPNNKLQYTPANGFIGIDSFKYYFFNTNNEQSNIATVYIMVNEDDLPIVSVHFFANKMGDKAQLLWNTTNEIDIVYFEIFRSVDGVNWKYLGKVAATGGINAPNQNYTFIDSLPAQGTNYYRLTIWDKNNRSHFSEIRQLNFDLPIVIIAWPNPVNDLLRISIKNGKATRLRLYDMSGKLVYIQNIQGEFATINMQRFAQGIYILQVMYETGGFKTIKIFKW